LTDFLKTYFNESLTKFDKNIWDLRELIALNFEYFKLSIAVLDVEHIMNYWNKWCKVKDKSKDMYKNVLTPREKTAIDKEKTINELKEKQKKGTITYEEDQYLEFLERKPEKTYKRSDREAYGVDGLLRKAKEGIAKYKDINEWKKLTSEEKQAVCRYIFLVTAAHAGKKFESYYTADDIKEFKKLFSDYSNVVKESPHIVRYFKTHCGEYRDRMNGGRKLKETMIMKGGVIGFNDLLAQISKVSDVANAVSPTAAWSNMLGALSAANDLRMATGQILRNKVLPGANLKNSPVGAVLSKFGF
jgi:hypothetical protein